MKKIVLASLLLIPASAFADNVGGCGWGSKLFDGQRGVFPQILAVTTNGTSGNQTFGISSATSGCTRDGVVKSNWKTALFIDANRPQLARDLATGEGESLKTLVGLMEIAPADREHFVTAVRSNYSTVFASENAGTEEIVNGLNEVLANDSSLKGYTINL